MWSHTFYRDRNFDRNRTGAPKVTTAAKYKHLRVESKRHRKKTTPEFPAEFNSSCPVGWSCRIHRLLLCRGVRPPRYDTKQSDGEVPAMLELWGLRSTSSLPSLPDPLWRGVVAPANGPIYRLNRTKLWFVFTVFCI